MKSKYILALLLVTSAVWGLGTGSYRTDGLSIQPGGKTEYSTAVNQWYKLYSSNCSLWVSNFGTYGGEIYFTDYGFRYNTSQYSDPEHHGSTGRCLTDSPTQVDYSSEVNSVAYMHNAITLPSTASAITLSFYAHWDIEYRRDYCEVVYTTVTTGTPAEDDWIHLNATSTVPPSELEVQDELESSEYIYANYPSEQENWSLEEADLTSLAGDTIKLGFRFRTDHSNPSAHDGIFIDDLTVTADSTPVYENSFDTYLDNWTYYKYIGNGESWGLSTSLSDETILMKNGQLLVGNSATYVANSGDWGAISNGVFNGSTELTVHFSNSGTIQTGDPEFGIVLYSYAFPECVILDHYVKNISGDTFNNVHIGQGCNASIEFGGDSQGNEWFKYDSGYDAGIWCNVGDYSDGPMLGVIYLNTEDNTRSFNVGGALNPSNDEIAYGSMSNGEHDYTGVWSDDGRWIGILGVGPFTFAPQEQRRFAVGYVGGDGETELEANMDECINKYGLIEENISIKSASLGEIKAMFR